MSKAAWKEPREQCHEWAQQQKCNYPVSLPILDLTPNRCVSGPMGDHDLFYIQRYVLEERKANGVTSVISGGST